MMKEEKANPRMLKEAHGMAKSLYKYGAIDLITMRKFDESCIQTVENMTAAEIAVIRKKSGMSQAVFAKVVNVSLSAIKQWEKGDKKPNGAALKLLNLIQHKGIEIAY